MREANVLRLLEDPECPARIVEVRLFREWSSDSASQTGRWITNGDLAKTAREISKFIADSDAVDVRIFLSDEA
jgi:hypothetical protein